MDDKQFSVKITSGAQGVTAHLDGIELAGFKTGQSNGCKVAFLAVSMEHIDIDWDIDIAAAPEQHVPEPIAPPTTAAIEPAPAAEIEPEPVIEEPPTEPEAKPGPRAVTPPEPKPEPEAVTPPEPKPTTKKPKPNYAAMSIDSLDLTDREIKALEKEPNNIYTIADLQEWEGKELKKIFGISSAAMYRIRWGLHMLGTTLKNEKPPRESPEERDARIEKQSKSKLARMGKLPPLEEAQLHHICPAPMAQKTLRESGIPDVSTLTMYTAKDLFVLLRSENTIETIKKNLAHYGRSLALK